MRKIVGASLQKLLFSDAARSHSLCFSHVLSSFLPLLPKKSSLDAVRLPKVPTGRSEERPIRASEVP